MRDAMIETVLCTEDLPAEGRFHYLRELMALAPAPMDLSSDHTAGLRVRKRDLRLGTIRAWTMAFQPMTFHRTAQLIEQSDPETYNICLLQRGAMELVRGKHRTIYEPRDLYVLDSSQAFELRAHNVQGLISCAGIEVPKRLLPLPHGQADQIIGRPMSGGEGIGALLTQFLTSLTAEISTYRTDDGPRLGMVATDLISALFAHILDEDDSSPEARRRTLIRRIRTFIQQNLDDPSLTPRAIAAAHHISPSYLHRLFQDEQLTVAAWIRHQRMERVRRDLTDRTMHPTPIHAIAARWGFPRPADFTRAFRTAYGLAPSDYRRQALHTGQTGTVRIVAPPAVCKGRRA